MRLDVYLSKSHILESRSKAKELILKGYVKVNGIVIKKPSFLVDESDEVEVLKLPEYVSRAGYKLEKAIDEFGIDLKDKVCLDVGSSTGGFTECMLRNGAKKVFAVDVGKEQMHFSLRSDERVVLFEETDIRYFKPDERFDFASIDVSFISLRLVLKPVKDLLKNGAEVVALIKPQFEVGVGGTKKGIVRDEDKIKGVINDIKNFAKAIGFEYKGLIESPIKGKEGNREFLIWLKNG
ncbi:TlyA family RNA methyltransferase [Hippea alviniae]|uniref:23S rRNA (cytidine-2'-O)-methyltransferase TlyA n=1 Tax=Hippea alviniae TaxID=1279027 RepID=UPI0003B62098|nr:TlyA family RNA methyltransferase [Hippea alviniae]